MNLEDILTQSPDIPGYGGGKWAMYSVHCCWWTSFPEDLGNMAKLMPERPKILDRQDQSIFREVNFDGLPCCPHCGSVLLQAPLEKFIQAARQNPGHYGERGLATFAMAHSRNTRACYRNWRDYEPRRLRHG